MDKKIFEIAKELRENFNCDMHMINVEFANVLDTRYVTEIIKIGESKYRHSIKTNFILDHKGDLKKIECTASDLPIYQESVNTNLPYDVYLVRANEMIEFNENVFEYFERNYNSAFTRPHFFGEIAPRETYENLQLKNNNWNQQDCERYKKLINGYEIRQPPAEEKETFTRRDIIGILAFWGLAFMIAIVVFV